MKAKSENDDDELSSDLSESVSCRSSDSSVDIWCDASVTWVLKLFCFSLDDYKARTYFKKKFKIKA